MPPNPVRIGVASIAILPDPAWPEAEREKNLQTIRQLLVKNATALAALRDKRWYVVDTHLQYVSPHSADVLVIPETYKGSLFPFLSAVLDQGKALITYSNPGHSFLPFLLFHASTANRCVEVNDDIGKDFTFAGQGIHFDVF